MSDKKQQETERPEWLHEAGLWVKRWWHKLCLLIKEHWLRIFILFPSGVLVIIASFVICLLYLSPEQRAANDHTALIVYLIGLAVTGGLVLCKPQIITSNPKKYFITRVLVTGITGGAFALLLPIAVKSTTTGVGGLRHSILLATGGLLAILTLGETRRKNDIDKRKNKQEKKKNDKDYRRQVRAERRERYTKAVEQLGDEKAPIRMGGVYTLVGLVDEWLEDKSLSDDQRLKEGQVIINNLCAYIRSPFTLASYYDELSKPSPTPKGIYKGKKEKFYADKSTLDSEADVRLSIIKEIHDRLQGSSKNTPGAWSDFEYDFSGSIFFYPIDLTKSYYKKPVNFSGSVYKGRADFSRSTYKDWADFNDSTYQSEVYFRGSNYKGGADFSRSTYKGGADFNDSTYKSWADFSRSTYQSEVYFGDSTYKGGADFGDSTYKDWADFSRSTYQSEVYFSDSTYKGGVDFSRSTYQSEVYFSDSTYQNEANFSGSIFYSEIYFGQDGDNGSFYRFTGCAPQFYDETNRKNTLFGSHNNDFTVIADECYPIDLNSEGLPLGCKFLSSEQKEYLADKFQEIEKINDKLFDVKDPEEKVELSKKLWCLNEELHKWREEATTVKVEDLATEETES